MSKYNLAVVGAGLGGLAAAALASRMNKRTIVLEPGNAVGGGLGIYEKNGFTFSLGPTLSFGFERGGAFQQLNEFLGIAQNASLRSPCYQVALPDRRITVYTEHSETLDELRREFPQEIDRISKFYHDIRKQAIQLSKSRISQFLSTRRSALGFIQSYRFSREFIAFLDVQSYYFFQQPAAALSKLSLIALCDSAPFTLQGGFRSLADQILNVLLKNGGEIRYQVPLADISLKTRMLSTPKEHIEADSILLNTEQHQQKYICIGLREEVIPVNMLPEVLCVPDYTHPELFFSLSLSAGDDESVAPRGMRTLTATFSSAGRDQTNDERRRQIHALIPFLNDFAFFVEEYNPIPRSYVVPDDMSFKTVWAADKQALLMRSRKEGIYMISDGLGTPAQHISAAERFVERIK